MFSQNGQESPFDACFAAFAASIQIKSSEKPECSIYWAFYRDGEYDFLLSFSQRRWVSAWFFLCSKLSKWEMQVWYEKGGSHFQLMLHANYIAIFSQVPEKWFKNFIKLLHGGMTLDNPQLIIKYFGSIWDGMRLFGHTWLLECRSVSTIFRWEHVAPYT